MICDGIAQCDDLKDESLCGKYFYRYEFNQILSTLMVSQADLNNLGIYKPRQCLKSHVWKTIT